MLRSSDLHHRESIDSGFTLLELLIAVVITSMLMILMGRILTDTSNGMARAVDNNIAVQQVLRLSRMVKYDVAGSEDVYVFGQNYSSSALRCSTATTSSNWSPAAQTTELIRPLFTIKIRDVSGGSYDRLQRGAPSTFLDTKYEWVGYELYRAAWLPGTRAPNYEIRRVGCPDTASHTPAGVRANDTEMMVSLGTAVRASCAVGVPDAVGACNAGTSVLKCEADTCPEAASTRNYAFYSLNLPYAGNRSTLKALSGGGQEALGPIVGAAASSIDQVLSSLTRRVNADIE